jgi:hypothetical protein
MGAKLVCFTCRKSFTAPYGPKGPINSARYAMPVPTKCPDCSQALVVLSHHFRPPRKQATAKWKMVKYLVDQGFYYKHIYEHPWGGCFMPYPATMQEAKEFVHTYQAQARKEGVITNVPVATLQR